MTLSQSQGQALTALLGQLRKDWGLSGITAALKKASPLGSAAEVAVAACRVAANEQIRTPALIVEPGPHWQGLTAGSRLAPVMCQTHPGRKAGGCPECFKAGVPKPDDFVVPRRSKHLPLPCEMCGCYGCDPKHHEPMEDPHIQNLRDREDEILDYKGNDPEEEL